MTGSTKCHPSVTYRLFPLVAGQDDFGHYRPPARCCVSWDSVRTYRQLGRLPELDGLGGASSVVAPGHDHCVGLAALHRSSTHGPAPLSHIDVSTYSSVRVAWLRSDNAYTQVIDR